MTAKPRLEIEKSPESRKGAPVFSLPFPAQVLKFGSGEELFGDEDRVPKKMLRIGSGDACMKYFGEIGFVPAGENCRRKTFGKSVTQQNLTPPSGVLVFGRKAQKKFDQLFVEKRVPILQSEVFSCTVKKIGITQQDLSGVEERCEGIMPQRGVDLFQREKIFDRFEGVGLLMRKKAGFETLQRPDKAGRKGARECGAKGRVTQGRYLFQEIPDAPSAQEIAKQTGASAEEMISPLSAEDYLFSVSPHLLEHRKIHSESRCLGPVGMVSKGGGNVGE